MNLKVVTPIGTVVDTKVDSISLVSAEGFIEIFPNHANYTGLLLIGLLTYTIGNDKYKLVNGNGFIQISDDEVSIITDSVDTKETAIKFKYNKSEITTKLNSLEASERTIAKNQLAKVLAVEELLSIN